MTRHTDYYLRVRTSNAGCLMSTVCTYCYRAGGRVSFFGAENTMGGAVWGTEEKDWAWRKAIWTAAQKHLQAVHNKKIVKNGRGGWKVANLPAGQ